MTDARSNPLSDSPALVEHYLHELRRGLRGLPSDEVDDIVREIASHLRERIGNAAEPQLLRDVMKSLGPAADLAASYRTEMQLERARGGYSPFTLMHALLQWAPVSAFGFLVAMVGLVGYTLGFTALATAVVKPFFREVGLWIGPGTLVLGHVDDPQARELLGWWIIPLGLIFGLVAVIATSRLLRWLIGRRRSTRAGRSLAALALVLLLGGLPSAGAAAEIADLRAEISGILTREGVAGAGVAMLLPDGRIESFGVGVADQASGEAVTAESRFRAGSITKSFTSLLIMQLVEEGRLALDQPLAEIAPEIAVVNPWESTAPVTVRHLLQHSTGFDDMKVSESWTLDQAAAQISLGEVLELRGGPFVCRFRPGTMTSYSNPGYTILGYLAEKLSGERYEDLVRTRIFEPLGMDHASLEYTGAENDVSRGYEAHDGTAFPPYQILHRPAGSLVVSAAELARFARLLARRGTVDGRQLLSPKLVEEMESSQASMATRAGFTIGYGAGIHSHLCYPLLMHGHDGGMPGFMGTFAYHREKGFGLVVLLNTVSLPALQDIAQLIFKRFAGPWALPELPVAPAADPAAWTGHYRLMTYRPELAAPVVRLLDRIDLSVEEGQLVEHVAFGDRRALVPAEGGSWRRASDPLGTRRLLVDERGRKWLLTPFDAYLEADPWLWRLELVVVALVAGLSLLPLLWVPGWAVLALWRRFKNGVRPSFPLWPVLAAACLVTALLVPSFLHWMSIATVNPWTVTLAVASGGFGVCAAFGLIRALLASRVQPTRVWLFPLLVPALMQLSLTLYLWYWGLLGLRMWKI